MRKPNNWDSTTAYGEYTPLAPGGYVCVIKKIEETTSRTNKPMLNIYLDIAEGAENGKFERDYRADTRDNKRWGCIVYQLVEDEQGNCNKGLKTFITAVERSNPSFSPDSIWGGEFANAFKGKLVGGVFRREQYVNQNMELRFSTKCFAFRSVESIRNGVEPPADKLLDNAKVGQRGGSSSWEEMDDDGDLPF